MQAQGQPNFRLLNVLTGIFVGSLLVANATSAKFFALGPFDLPGGLVIFPLSFIFGDVLTEVYGYEQTKKVIWTGFGCQLMAAATYSIVGHLPPAAFWHDQSAYDAILGSVPRITAASIIAYLCGEFCNSGCVSVMKFHSDGKRGFAQAARFVVSTVVGQAIDTAIFMSVAFIGVHDLKAIIASGLSLYVFKVGYEVIALPISLPFSNWLKRIENVDTIDTPETVRYNPFRFNSSNSPRESLLTALVVAVCIAAVLLMAVLLRFLV